MGKAVKLIRIIRIVVFIILSLFSTSHSIADESNAEGNANGKVECVQNSTGDWDLMVDGEPYVVKGILYNPVRIGEDPSSMTMSDWMFYDENKNSLNDPAYDSWIDRDNNNKQGLEEGSVGDFQILKDMGANTLRFYHAPSDNPILKDIYRKNEGIRLQFDHAINKELLRDLYHSYGIRVIMGHFLGSWTIGCGTTWEEGCDYSNPVHRERIKRSVRAYVEDNKDEPYILMWMLGNENNIATWSNSNAARYPKEYLTMVNDIAQMIHQLDPNHPVALCEGYVMTQTKLYSEFIPDIDVIAYNAYTGPQGFGFLWKVTKRNFDRPVLISEFGMPAFNAIDGLNENLQADYHEGSWGDIYKNTHDAKRKGQEKSVGNSIGGIVFDFLDRWYMDGSPYVQNEGTKHFPFTPDQKSHEEYYGITSMGDGRHSIFMRQLRASYTFYAQEWNQDY